MTKKFRIEKDSMGTIEVPIEALWGAQTQRSIINFSIGEDLIPIELIYSLTLIKKACLLYTSPSPRDSRVSRMPSSA